MKLDFGSEAFSVLLAYSLVVGREVAGTAGNRGTTVELARPPFPHDSEYPHDPEYPQGFVRLTMGSANRRADSYGALIKMRFDCLIFFNVSSSI